MERWVSSCLLCPARSRDRGPPSSRPERDPKSRIQVSEAIFSWFSHFPPSQEWTGKPSAYHAMAFSFRTPIPAAKEASRFSCIPLCAKRATSIPSQGTGLQSDIISFKAIGSSQNRRARPQHCLDFCCRWEKCSVVYAAPAMICRCWHRIQSPQAALSAPQEDHTNLTPGRACPAGVSLQSPGSIASGSTCTSF